MGVIADAAYIAYQNALKLAQLNGTPANLAALEQAAEKSRQMNALEQASWANQPAAAPPTSSNAGQPAPPNPTPQTIPNTTTVYAAPTTFAVKQPESSLVQYVPESLGQEVLTDMYYEDIGGVELISISRYDTINGQPVIYSLIKNLSSVNRIFDPNNILAGQASTNILEQFAIDITSKLIGVSLDSSGDLIVEFSSVGTDDYLEALVSSDGTIYRIAI